MTLKKISNVLYILIVGLFIVGCSKDEIDSSTEDRRSFTVSTTNDFFINKNETVDFKVTAVLKDDTAVGNIINRGIVYGLSSKPTVSINNTVNVHGASNDAFAYLLNLDKNEIYFVRGYFKMENGTYFYGPEVQLNTNVEASSTRMLSMEMQSTAFFTSSTEITPVVKILSLTKEMPIEIGIEYSVNPSFSNSTLKLLTHYNGVHNNGIILVTTYSEVISGLTSATQYYFRPYAKYADNTITHGGVSTAILSTSN